MQQQTEMSFGKPAGKEGCQEGMLWLVVKTGRRKRRWLAAWKQWKYAPLPKAKLLTFKRKTAMNLKAPKASPQTSELTKFYCSCLRCQNRSPQGLQGEKLKNISCNKDISVVRFPNVQLVYTNRLSFTYSFNKHLEFLIDMRPCAKWRHKDEG